MSNSSLVTYTKISPHKTSPRQDKIRKITIHHMAGNLTVQECGEVFQTREASANYGIDNNCNVGLYVEEKDRAWASGSGDNDHQSVNIELANDQIGGQWHVADKVIAKCIDLCVDICKRNGISKLNFTGNKNGNLTMHCYFASTACPGPYLKTKFKYIADEVNKRLSGVTPAPTPAPTPVDPETYQGTFPTEVLLPGDTGTQVGYLQNFLNWYGSYKLAHDNSYGPATTAAVKDFQKTEGIEVDGNFGPISNETARKAHKKSTPAPASTPSFTPYTVQITTDALRIRKGPGTNYEQVGCVYKGEVYTIVDKSNDGTYDWGKLKSSMGWICLYYTKKY